MFRDRELSSHILAPGSRISAPVRASRNTDRLRALDWVSLHFVRNAGLPNGCYLLQMSLTMSDGTHLTTWVTRETKERFATVAHHQGLSDSALLKRLVDLMLQSASAAGLGTPGGADRTSRASRFESVPTIRCYRANVRRRAGDPNRFPMEKH